MVIKQQRQVINFAATLGRSHAGNLVIVWQAMSDRFLPNNFQVSTKHTDIVRYIAPFKK